MRRRYLIGWLRRKTRWEFLPPWLTYLPVAPYLIFLGARHRSLTLFTAANPGMPAGGFVGESKSEILSSLIRVAEFTVIPGSLSPRERVRAAAAFLRLRRLSFPVVLKPDVGERGTGVAIVRSARELRTYLESAAEDTIIQRFIGGMEFGVFYCRFPGDPRGRILSITDKRFPAVTGDGESTIAELILQDERAVCLAALYLARLKRPPEEIPAAGEVVPIAELGSHCRGAIFLNGAHLETEALRDAVDGVAQCHPGFFFGRFDLRAASITAFQAGEFEVLELNGVSAEPTHIYDPSVSLVDAYRALFRHWRMAFQIGAINRRAGCKPTTLWELLRLVRSRNTGQPRNRQQKSGGFGKRAQLAAVR